MLISITLTFEQNIVLPLEVYVDHIKYHLHNLLSSLRDSDFHSARAATYDLQEIVDSINANGDFDSRTQVLESFESEQILFRIDLLDVEFANNIYQAETPEIVVLELVKKVDARLIELLFRIDPREFEELIAELFENQGFSVELTKRTRDGGKDIIAFRRDRMGIENKYLIECKRYAPHKKVTLDVVQRLYGVKLAESANRAVVATTSTFTRDALVFADSHPWDLALRDNDDIVSWLDQYKC